MSKARERKNKINLQALRDGLRLCWKVGRRWYAIHCQMLPLTVNFSRPMFKIPVFIPQFS